MAMISDVPDARSALAAAWPLLALVAIVLGALAVLLAQPWWTERRRARLRARPFPTAWRRILRRRVPAVARLPPDLQQRLKGHILVFLAEKPFIGCGAQVISDDQRVTIAAQACLLLLGQPRPRYYPRLREVLVYPDAFVVDRVMAHDSGVVQARRQALSGESWTQGRVILSWAETLAGAADPADGRNVVLHEFAHQIDQDKGVADGRPWRASRAQRRRWTQVMGEAYAHLRQQPSALISDYGATEPAEFFAVLSELFFEQPQALAAEVPAVYRELALLYQVNPLAW
jgi:Mlc titration factor MtfA (ptsG expression regulator)